jgi:hypothetical protein
MPIPACRDGRTGGESAYDAPMEATTGTRRPWAALARSFGLAVVALALATGAHAQADVQAEYRVKAAFLYKFLAFVEWPPQAFERTDSPLVIGVLGADALADELETIVAGRSVNERRVLARRVRHGDPLAGVHVLFVGRQLSARLPALATASRGQPLLTVSESAEPVPGSVINFVVLEDRVRFDIAPAQAELARLKISSRLLALARRVLPGPE